MSYKILLTACFLSLKAFAFTGIVEKEFLFEEDAKKFTNSIENFANNDFLFEKELSLLQTEEYKKALSFLYLTKNQTSNVSFSDFSKLYFATPALPKKDIVYKKIREYVLEYKASEEEFVKKFSEIEEIVWFYVIIENENLLNFLTSSRMSVNSFLDLLKEKKDFSLLQKILNLKEEEISEMLWEENITKALPLILAMPTSIEKSRFLARIFFKTRNEKYKVYAKDLIEKNDFEDDGFVYDYVQYLKKTEHYKTALTLIMNTKINYKNPRIAKFWALKEELFRHYIDAKEYEQAYLVASRVKFGEEMDFNLFARSEFLAGFVAMKFLKDEKLAIKHFENLYKSKLGNVYTKSRGAYFLSRIYAASGKKSLERQWLLEASKYITTFYGIVALDKLNNIEAVSMLGLNIFTEKRIEENKRKRELIHKQYFDSLLSKYYNENSHFEESTLKNLKQNINFKIGLIMLLNGYRQEAGLFFSLSVLEMSEKELKFAFDLLEFKIKEVKIENGIQILNTFSSKAANQGVLIVESYPLLDFVLENDFLKQNALIHAVIKQESNFVLRAISGPGAIGLMQVMPATGKIVSKSVNLDFNINRLKNDYKYNIQIGSYYLDLLLNKFNLSVPLALAGYNAGPNRIPQWQKRFFEAKTEDEMVDFIELIPFKETREYVLRVMENEVFYDYLIKNHTTPNSNLPLLKKDQAFNEFLKKHGNKQIQSKPQTKKPKVKQKPLQDKSSAKPSNTLKIQ